MSEPRIANKAPGGFERTLRRLTLDLKEADRFLSSAGLPHKTLEELSETVDHLRATTWAVMNAVSDDIGDAKEAPTLLTTHRIQRTRALLLALNAEMDTGHVAAQTAGAHDLCTALGTTFKKLHYVLHGKPVPPEER
jgi:hypothetical protein